MAFWTAERIMPRRERLALHCLKLSGFETYVPRTSRIVRGRKVNEIAPLFPSYVFILIDCSGTRPATPLVSPRSSWTASGRRACLMK